MSKAKKYQNAFYNANKKLKRSSLKVREMLDELSNATCLTKQAQAALEPYKGIFYRL
jgi:hypothetical protein